MSTVTISPLGRQGTVRRFEIAVPEVCCPQLHWRGDEIREPCIAGEAAGETLKRPLQRHDRNLAFEGGRLGPSKACVERRDRISIARVEAPSETVVAWSMDCSLEGDADAGRRYRGAFPRSLLFGGSDLTILGPKPAATAGVAAADPRRGWFLGDAASTRADLDGPAEGQPPSSSPARFRSGRKSSSPTQFPAPMICPSAGGPATRVRAAIPVGVDSHAEQS